jgi:glycosyltransferase involved in cell wall biosynthesis
MKAISIMTPCFNEEAHVEELYTRVRKVMAVVGRYRYEHIFIDNRSTDRTVEVLKRIAAADTNVKLIVNARNFGHVRSAMHARTRPPAMPSSELWPIFRTRRR